MAITHQGHLMFIICMSHHACMTFLYMIYRPIIPVIVTTFSSQYCQTYCSYILLIVTTFSYSLLPVSCTLASPLLTDHYIIFQYLDQETGIESCLYIIFWFSYPPVSLVFFLDLFYSDIVDDIVYDSLFSYM